MIKPPCKLPTIAQARIFAWPATGQAIVSSLNVVVGLLMASAAGKIALARIMSRCNARIVADPGLLNEHNVPLDGWVSRLPTKPGTQRRTNMNQECQAAAEMPRYKCHKEVWALKIKAIEDPNNATDGSRLMVFEDQRYAPICVTGEYMTKHRPEAGGYYVVYADGYKSFSPAKAFEDGYSPA